MPTFTWQRSPAQVFPELIEAYADSVERMAAGVVQRYAPEVENYGKEHAPWTDRTANARQGLHTRVERNPRLIRLWFQHGVEYGIYLELSNAGRYAIINPTLDLYGHRIWNDIRQRLR